MLKVKQIGKSSNFKSLVEKINKDVKCKKYTVLHWNMLPSDITEAVMFNCIYVLGTGSLYPVGTSIDTFSLYPVFTQVFGILLSDLSYS